VFAHLRIITSRFGEQVEALGQIRRGELVNHFIPPQPSRFPFLSLSWGRIAPTPEGIVSKANDFDGGVAIWLQSATGAPDASDFPRRYFGPRPHLLLFTVGRCSNSPASLTTTLPATTRELTRSGPLAPTRARRGRSP